MKKKKKLKLKIKNVLLLFFMILFIYSLINILIWLKNSYDTKKQIKSINKTTKVEIIKNDDNIKYVDEDPDFYHLYKDVELINVDFKELIKINDETKGWLKVNGTNINYPFVQGINNDFYLTHTYNKKGNGGGWVFMDYRNDPNFKDQNTIIYGHGREDKTIFGTLGYVLNDGYIDKTENQFIMTSTPKVNMTWQIFSAYKIPNTNDYLQINFSNEEETEKFYKMLKKRNQINIDIPVNPTDKILTLSTCFNNDIKIVVHAKLVKYLER